MGDRQYQATDVRVNIDGEDGRLLREMAADDVRNVTEQIRWLIRSEVARRTPLCNVYRSQVEAPLSGRSDSDGSGVGE